MDRQMVALDEGEVIRQLDQLLKTYNLETKLSSYKQEELVSWIMGLLDGQAR